ncbi:IclR family transcriptional regulator [Tsukamurella soli]|uniref:IclR family transcriptional regulator n=1 Tax=Tsukamurella soli TaxID=644556 RepID=A0ABP8JWI7_9ACTN
MGNNSAPDAVGESAADPLAVVSGIGVLDKAVAVLRTAAAEPASLADLCERTGLPRATAHRLAVGLEVHRLLARDGDGLWRPGAALRELAASDTDALLAAAALILPRLREITGESVQLYRREGDHRVCVAAAEPPFGLRDTVPVGARLPMDAGSGAKVLLAWTERTSHHAATGAFGERSLAEVRRRGWAQSAGEREPGVASVSAPVRDSRGEVVAAISVSGPIDRMGRRPGARWAADLLQAADALHRRL